MANKQSPEHPQQTTFDDPLGATANQNRSEFDETTDQEQTEPDETTDQEQTEPHPSPGLLFYTRTEDGWTWFRKLARYARNELGRDDLTDERVNNAVDNKDVPSGLAFYSDSPDEHPSKLNHGLTEVEEHPISHVVIPSLTHLGGNWRDVHDAIKGFIDEGTAIHSIREDLVIRSESGELNALRAVAESERRDSLDAAKRRIQARETGEWIGRPPIGFTVENGVLAPADGYDELVAALEQVDDNPEKTVYWASKVTGYSRDSLRKALTEPDRRELYGLDPLDGE